MKRDEFIKSQMIYRPTIPSVKIKGNKKIMIEIDEQRMVNKFEDPKRIKITCFDFQLAETLERYKSRNPIIIKEWS
jgi:hypothetical protein